MIQRGIYLIINNLTKDFYLGSSNHIEKRFSTHQRELEQNKHHSSILQRAWNKYGSNNFSFEIFINENNNLLELEQFCLDFLSPRYNIAISAMAPMKGRKHSKETLLKFKKRKVKRGKDHYMYGKTLSQDIRAKIALANTGKKHTEEYKKRMSKIAKKLDFSKSFNRKMMMKSVIDNLGNKFVSITEAAEFHNISRQTVCDILKGRHLQTRKGVCFDYAI